MLTISLATSKRNNISSPDMKGILTNTENGNLIPVIAYLDLNQNSLSIAESKYQLKSTEIKNIQVLIELESTAKTYNSKYPDFVGRIIEQDKTIVVVAWSKLNGDSMFPMLIKKNIKQ